MNHNIFISYSSKQKSIADGVCHYLEENGFKCWMAPRDIPAGSEYTDLIVKAIKSSNVVVLIYSQSAGVSRWVKSEINIAFSSDKPILPFRIDETRVVEAFEILNQIHWIDAFPQYADRLPDLLNSVCGFLGRQPQKVSNERERLATDRKAKEEAERERLEREQKTKQTNGHEYVDLGLPSGTLWATCNVGANKPEDYGDYFAWGEINTKSVYDWNTYKYTNGDYNKLTKYCDRRGYGNNGFTDALIELQTSDDPATTNWGDGWNTPSKDQWDELLANTTCVWATCNGVGGMSFTSKQNGQTLFLPSAGYRGNSLLSFAGDDGYYWSSSLHSDYPDRAWFYKFDWTGDCEYGSRMCADARGYGQSVRPVRQN